MCVSLMDNMEVKGHEGPWLPWRWKIAGTQTEEAMA